MAFKIRPAVQSLGILLYNQSNHQRITAFIFTVLSNWFTQISGEQDHSWRGNQKTKPSSFLVKSQPRGSRGPKQGSASISKHAVHTQRTHLVCSKLKLRRKHVSCLLDARGHSFARHTPPGHRQPLAHTEQWLKEKEPPWSAHKGSNGAQLSFPRHTGTQPTDSTDREMEQKT